jgi:hypothetical protein
MYRTTRTRIVAPVLLALCLALPPALAAERVVFAENFSMTD